MYSTLEIDIFYRSHKINPSARECKSLSILYPGISFLNISLIFAVKFLKIFFSTASHMQELD
jgi:hypothetical protein